MKKNDNNNEKKLIPIKKDTIFNRQKSMQYFHKTKKEEKINQKKRNTKSREKEIIRTNMLPIIKNNLIYPNKKPNNKSKTIQKNISRKESKSKLPNLVPKKPLKNNIVSNENDDKNKIIDNKVNKNSIKDKININNNNTPTEMIQFFEDFIELSNSVPNKNLLISFLNNFHKKYLLHFSKNAISKIENNNFITCLKYSFVVISCLLFFSKDDTNHQFNSQRLKELIDQFIFISLNNMKINASQKIKIFKNKMKPTKKSFQNSVNAIIKLIYNNKNEYNTLKNAFNQLITNVIKNCNINDFLNTINNSILYCFNHQNLNLNNKNKFLLKNNVASSKNKKNKKFPDNNNQEQTDELIPSAPYIKTEMTKKFCLVLDIDETITHTLKLPFGDYFLVRPGVKEFLKEMIKHFEIVIFTSSPKSYADNILDKIDINNEFFSYRLYRKHVVYENGNSVKKLDMIGRNLNKIIFVDNLKSNAKYNPDNLYHIKTWTNDLLDNQLIILKDKLKDIATSGQYDDDIRKGLSSL